MSSVVSGPYRILKQIHGLPERFRIWRGDHSAHQLSTLTSPRFHIQNHTSLLRILVPSLLEEKINQTKTGASVDDLSLQQCLGFVFRTWIVVPLTRCPEDVPGVSESTSKSACRGTQTRYY